MSFGQPLFLWGFILIPFAIVVLIWARNQRRMDWARLGDSHLLGELAASVNWIGRRWQSRLWLLGLVVAIFAMARPQWGSEVQVVEQEGIQLMVALDVSQSMLAEDITPNRLARAKQEISELMDQLQGDEIGLVLFSGAAFVQFPLTSDYDTARAFLQNAHPGMISRPGTVIGEAIRTALAGFDRGVGSQKVIVIMTDGEDHETDPMDAAQEAASEDVIVYTIGFGSVEGEPIPEYDIGGNRVGYKEDRSGNVVLSKLDEVGLQQIAVAGNGRYYRAESDGSELRALTAELDALETAQLESRFETQKIERYQPFLLIAILLLFACEWIPERRRITERKTELSISESL
ncbi:MAG: VWA domain-containing protein [Chloroflexota bacterium]